MVSTELLRRDVRMLGDMLGDAITELAGVAAFQLVEEIRQLSRGRRSGVPDAECDLVARIAGLKESEARVVSRAFSIFFDLSNLAEDLHRVRVLRSRELERYPEPLSESIGAGIARMHAAGLSAEQVQQALDKLKIELVFTAHPSEAKRRSIRAKLRRMRQALQELDRPDLLPRERGRLEIGVRNELTILWQTEFLRPWRPTVLQEVERGLSITPRLWDTVPQIYDALRQALEARYPGHLFRIPVFLRFGSWMGGDRDGNPNVTADVTAQTLAWLRDAAIDQHLAASRRMFDFLSISVREKEADQALKERVGEALRQWPALATELDAVAPLEIYRRWISVIQWRLKQSRGVQLFARPPEGAYRDGLQLEADLQLMCDSLRQHHGELLLDSEVQKWLDLARVFGLHLTRLDVRQDARRYREIMTEIFRHLQLSDDFAALTEPERQDLLSRTMDRPRAIWEKELSPLTRDTLRLFRLMRAAMLAWGDVFGGHVISLTREPSDVLSVLWLWRWAQADVRQTSEFADAAVDLPGDADLRIIPLFEKIGDLQQAPGTLEGILAHPAYAAHLARQASRQIVMVGYSDSTKDGGYLAACWGLYQAQSNLQKVADRAGVRLTFFHGRGGSLGRGGGPAARGILSLPPEALDGSLRLTEQGEVLAERYDDPQVAYRHLEQVTFATLLASALPAAPVQPAWTRRMDELSRSSFEAYRELVEQPGFIQFFAEATPIEEIEGLPIGSRPSRRRGERTLEDLRAIPWVFAWTQNRCMIPAWYGLGTAVAATKDRDPGAAQSLRAMYAEWPFFQATIDNAALALAKADMYIAHRYAGLSEEPEARERFWALIAGEYDRTRNAILDLVGGTELLSVTPWFQKSIEVRNPYIDPLNLIQIELLRRHRTIAHPPGEDDADRLRDLLRLTVQGIAAGMRTTG